MADKDNQPYVGYRSAGRRPEAHNDRIASANFPAEVAKALAPQDLVDVGLMAVPYGGVMRKLGVGLVAGGLSTDAEAGALNRLLKAFHGARRPVEGAYDVSKASERSIMGKGLNVSTDPAYPSKWAMKQGSEAPVVYETAVPADKYIQLEATYPPEAFDALRKMRGRNPLPEGEVTGEQVYQTLRGLPQSMIPDAVLKSGYKGVEYPGQDGGRWFSIYDTEGVKDRLGKQFAEGGEVNAYGKGGLIKTALEEARDQILKLRALKAEGKHWLEDDKELPTRFYRGMAAMVKGGEGSPKDFDELTKQYLNSREPMSEIKSLVAAERPSGALSDQKNMRRSNAWAASNPLTAASYSMTPNSVMVPLELVEKPSLVLDAGGLRWDKYFPQTGRISQSGNYTLRDDFRDALRDPEVKSILVKNILDSGAGSTDELSRLYGLDISKDDLISHNLLIKDPSAVRYGISGEVPTLKEPKVKKAEGGLVEPPLPAAEFSPLEVDYIIGNVMSGQHETPEPESGYAEGGLVEYNPAKISSLVNALREELHA
jgi:hypothetical protein